MAISYDDWKKQYEGMTTEQQKNYANMVKGNATATEYANRYIQEKQNAGTYWTQTAKTSTPTTTSTNSSTSTNNYQNNYSSNGSNWGNGKVNSTPRTQEEINQSQSREQERIRNGDYDAPINQNQQFDSSKLTNPNAQVTVQAGNAAQTWMPDYQDTSDAREKEIINNLNAYWNTNKSFFADRATFNKTFHYDERNDSQKAILDSFWKGTENYNKATSYTDWKSFSTALNSWNVTEAQYAGMKDWNPEVFKEWQDQLKEEMNLAISNLSKITTNYDNAEILQTMMEKLWIEPQQWRDIIGWWEEMMDRTWAWSAMKDATKARESYNAVADKMTSIMNRYSSSTWGNQSDALVAARLQKALAPYQQQAQNYYSAWQMANTEFQTKLGTANNYVSTIQAQAAEDQRIFQQKITSLGFAMQVNSYRTPEQQAALQLQTQQIQNNMALYQQSRLNELSLYNQKQLNDLNLQYQEDLTKLQNKLSYELKDLSVEDPEQLRANLNNILTDYFSKYWDIIQRSQSQVVEDVIAYAKEKGISVAQALEENFITHLQNKQEYKNMIAKNYADPNPTKQQSWTRKDNWDGTSSLVISWVWEVPAWLTRPQRVEEYSNIFEQVWKNVENSAIAMAQAVKNWMYTWWCWEFVNDWLNSIWITDWFTDYLDEKMTKKNQDYPSIWSVAIMDFWVTDENWKPYWHVWIVSWINADWSIVITDSNWAWDKKKLTHTLSANDMKYVKWYYNPTKDLAWTLSNSISYSSTFEWNGNTYDFSKYVWWEKLTDDEKQTVENLLTYQTDPSSLPKSWKDNWASNQKVRAAAAAIWRDYGYSERKYSLVKNAEKKWDDAALPWGVSSANSTSMSILKAMYDSYSKWFNQFDINTINRWINDFKAETWDPTVWTQYATARVAASEIAKALKWWASPTEQEVEDMKNLLHWNMGNKQAMAVFQSFAKNLYEKNESEAKKFYETTWYKPNPIWTDEAQQWMSGLGIDLSKYYNYDWTVTVSSEWVPATSYSINFTSKYKK